MRESRIIIPDAPDVRYPGLDFVRKSLCRDFGGYTETRGRGGWINPDGKLYDENVTIFDIACDDTEATAGRLRFKAAAMAQLFHQECVYLRLPSGEVEFVYPPASKEERATA